MPKTQLTQKQLFKLFNIKAFENIPKQKANTKTKFKTYSFLILLVLSLISFVFAFLLKILNVSSENLSYQIYGYTFGLLLGSFVWIIPIIWVLVLLFYVLSFKWKAKAISFLKPFYLPSYAYLPKLKMAFILIVLLAVLIEKIVFSHLMLNDVVFDFSQSNAKEVFYKTWFGLFLFEKSFIDLHMGFILDNLLNLIFLLTMSPVLFYVLALICIFLIYWFIYFYPKKIIFKQEKGDFLTFYDFYIKISKGRSLYLIQNQTLELLNFLIYVNKKLNFINYNQKTYFEVLNATLYQLADFKILEKWFLKYQETKKNYLNKFQNLNEIDKTDFNSNVLKLKKSEIETKNLKSEDSKKFQLENTKTNLENKPHISIQTTDIKTKFTQNNNKEK
ncbi:hypothetical protein [Mycoplasma buteonis]|uniref:hypothetical protein n=1 Tax=Mycoplasma buteonis TaxID=171280 RepID=UPI00056B2874|nr:hypothetical protein [Mycoplasma buteonis]